MGSDLRAQAEQIVDSLDPRANRQWSIEEVKSALRGVRDAERQRLRSVVHTVKPDTWDEWTADERNAGDTMRGAILRASGADHAD